MATRKRMAGPVGTREPELTLSAVFRRFVTDGKHHADGSLKTEAYLRHCEQGGKHLARHFGPDYPARLLTPDKLREYTVDRREGRITGYPVRTNTIQRELGMLKAALNFACSVHDADGQPLMPRNPMEKLKLPREKDPKRPVIDRQTAQTLRDVADEVHRSLWHVFRRVWATERKHLPPKDVAAAGGWRDIQTLMTCYQQPDEETMREVVDFEKPHRAVSHQPSAVS